MAAHQRAGSPRMRIADTLGLGIFCGLIALIFLTPIPYGSVEPWAQAVFQCAVFGLALLWCIHATLTGSYFAGDVRPFAPIAATVLFAVLQSLPWSRATVAGVQVENALSADPYESWIFAIRLLSLMLAALLAVRFTTNTLRLTILANAVVLTACLSAVFGIIRLSTQHHDGFVLTSLRTGEGFAQFINKNHFAFLAEPAIGLLAGMILLKKGIGQRLLLYLSALIVLWAAIVLSRSRGGLLAVSIQMVVGGLFFISSKWPAANRSPLSRRTRTIGVVGATILAIVFTVAGSTLWLGGDQLSTGVETATSEMSVKHDDYHEGARRRDFWRATLLMARAHPIFGAGLGAYWAEIPLYHDASGILSPQQAHNEYLEIVASGGLIGVGLLTWFIVALGRRIQRGLATYSGEQRAIAMGAIIGVLGVAVHSLVDFGLHMTGNAVVFVMLLAILSLDALDQRVPAQAHRSATFS